MARPKMKSDPISIRLPLDVFAVLIKKAASKEQTVAGWIESYVERAVREQLMSK